MPIENDLPPGVPAYAAGAVPGTVAGFRASGQPDLGTYLNPPTPPPAPVAPPQPKIAAQSFLDHAENLASRAAQGIASLFGGGEKPAASPSVSAPVKLESDLDALQARSSPPNVLASRAAPAADDTE